MTQTQTQTIENYLDLVGVFEDIVERYHDITYAPILVAASATLQDLHRGYFESESDPSGVKWKPLASSTIRRKGHARILWETSALERSLVTVTGDSIRDVVSEGDQEWLVWGTAVEYAMYHQEPGALSKLPARKHVGVNKEFVDDLVFEVEDHTIEELKKNG